MQTALTVAALWGAFASGAQGELDASEAVLPRIGDDATVELEAFWEPCKRSLYHLFDRTPILREPKAAVKKATYGADDLRPFLPTQAVEVGEIWKIDENKVLPILEQFHPRAIAKESHGNGVRGAYGLVRALHTDAVEVLFRTHAYFHLTDEVRYIPAQFEGRLVLGREDGAIHSFKLALPSRDTNVDVNAPMTYRDASGKTRKSRAADIGWVPRMELTTGEPASFEWTSSIALEDARLRLSRQYYPFAMIDWLPFEEAIQKAKEEKKPLHAVLLFGSLDDESC